ncbi:MAG: NIPSNAP family protein [Alteromonadaceae bacterium]|nr:NIPSNAP family protein [Alteromonadaceae bacterium]
MAHLNERRNFLKSSVALGAALGVQSVAGAKNPDSHSSQEYYEWRAYKTVSREKKAAVSHYLEKALIPALGRMGIDRIGVFTHKHDPNDHTLYMLIPYKSLDDFAGVNPELADDKAYQAQAADYFSVPFRKPIFTRIESKLHKAVTGMPVLKLPPQSAQKEPRILELRVYQGDTEEKTALKIEQFNQGEIFVMQDVGLNPVFYGELLIGDDGPNMMYMTSASSEEVSQACWAKFKVHPEWTRLRNIVKYKGTVSSKTKDILVPTQYSQI